MNSVVISGRLTQDITLKTSRTGKPYTFNVIAVDKFVNNEKGTDFIPIVIFGRNAENIEKYSQKGARVTVAGTLQSGSYEKEGETKHSLSVAVEKIDFIDFRSNDTEQISSKDILEDVPFWKI